MKASKPILIAAAAIGSLAITATVAMAATTTSTGNTLADKIATKFNVNKDDVQKVIDEDRSAHAQEHEQRYEQMLNSAVTAGKLTTEQKDKILAKHKELLAQMQNDRDNFKNMSEADRHTAMQKKHDELTQWEKDNNVPTGYLMGAGRGGHMMHHGGMPDGDGPQ